ncbi:MAG TPA: hypothetical protein DCS93_31080 [Microscillaceae bacterium]|nr:hypothetical protein [Microscillaceae bacterium]
MKHLRYNIRVLFGIFAFVVIGLSSCKDKTSEQEVLNELERIAEENQVTNVTARVLSYPNNTPAAGATITFHQGGVDTTVTTNADGVAHLTLKRGGAEVTLAAADHATMRASFSISTSNNSSSTSFTARLLQTTGIATATISGRAVAEIDQTSNTRYQNVPVGTRVIAEVNLADAANGLLDGNNLSFTNVELPNLQAYETTVDGSGNYTFDVPAYRTGSQSGSFISYVIRFDEFTTNQRVAINNYLNGTDTTNQRSILGEFAAQEIPTRFGMFDTNDNDFTRIPTVNAVKVVASNSNSVIRRGDIYTAVVSDNNQGGDIYGRLGEINRAAGGSFGGTYTASSSVTFTATDILGNTATFTLTTAASVGALSATIDLINSGTPTAGTQALAPNTTFKIGTNANTYLTDANASGIANRTQQDFGFASLGGGVVSSVFSIINTGNGNQRRITLSNPEPGKTYKLDVSYGSGIRTLAVQ